MDVSKNPRKRLFLALSVISLLVISLFGYCVWKISYLGLADIHSRLPLLIGEILLIMFGVIVLGLVGLVALIAGIIRMNKLTRQTWWAVNLLFPLVLFIGKCAGINKSRIEQSFVAVSNKINRQRGVKVKPQQLLLITPHCLQQEDCPHKITRDVRNCKKCGRCQVKDLLLLAEKYGFEFAVVTGGTLSRQLIKKVRPSAVVAVACERDLTSGIQDIYPMPVIGVFNERPFGPCNNTRVNVALVEQAVLDLLE